MMLSVVLPKEVLAINNNNHNDIDPWRNGRVPIWYNWQLLWHMADLIISVY